MRGNGAFVCTDERDRPPEIFGGTTTLRSGGNQQSHVLLPFIPR